MLIWVVSTMVRWAGFIFQNPNPPRSCSWGENRSYPLDTSQNWRTKSCATSVAKNDQRLVGICSSWDQQNGLRTALEVRGFSVRCPREGCWCAVRLDITFPLLASCLADKWLEAARAARPVKIAILEESRQNIQVAKSCLCRVDHLQSFETSYGTPQHKLIKMPPQSKFGKGLVHAVAIKPTPFRTQKSGNRQSQTTCESRKSAISDQQEKRPE